MATNNSLLSPEYLTAPEYPEFSLFRESQDLMKSPNVMWPSPTEDSEAKQDSGYCSLTPLSSISNIFNQKCRLCFKTLNKSYAQSTPHYDTCNCKHLYSFEAQSSIDEFLETIPESKNIIQNQFSSERKQSVPLVFDEAMDSSLYNDEMEIEEFLEGQDSNLVSLDVSEEKSIDFLEDKISFLSSTSNDKCNTKDWDVKLDNSNHIAKKLFTPEDCLSTPDCESPKYQNKITPTKKNRPTFLKAATNVGILKKVLDLWSFKMNGIEEIDFLYQLGVKRSFPNIISGILSHLSEKDIDSVRKVSKTWRDVVSKDHSAFNRWTNYKMVMKLKQENYYSPRKTSQPVSESQEDSNQPMRNITNMNISPIKSWNRTSPVLGESLRFHCNQMAVKNLKAGERLLPCPKCSFPAHDHGNPTVECSRSGCRFRFCFWCRTRRSPCSKHICHLLAPRSPTSSPRPGSKACKRRLRRLSQLS